MSDEKSVSVNLHPTLHASSFTQQKLPFVTIIILTSVISVTFYLNYHGLKMHTSKNVNYLLYHISLAFDIISDTNFLEHNNKSSFIKQAYRLKHSAVITIYMKM